MAVTETSIDSDLPRSQATMAYRVIRNDILSGRHPPDKKLKIQDLADELGVSPGAIREALSRLVSAQLVVSQDQRGFAVAPLSIDDLIDLTELRCEVEAIALRRSVELGDVDWEAALLAAAHRLRSIPILSKDRKQGVNAEWRAAHGAFHAALIAGCGSPRLKALHAHLFEQSERYRVLSGKVESNRDIVAEHESIVRLALARKAEELVDAMSRHLRETTHLIVAAREAPAARKAAGRVARGTKRQAGA